MLTGLLGTNLSFLVVERMPRNVVLASGMIAVSIPLACEAAMTARYLGTTNESGLGAGVAFLYLYIFTYGIFLEGPGYYYVSRNFGLCAVPNTDLTARRTRFSQLTCAARVQLSASAVTR